ncbi:MAG: hypothetical protein SH868_06365 [Bythopirellula sp.]|nr:hypothetical protein [Bythopirellula sp.]
MPSLLLAISENTAIPLYGLIGLYLALSVYLIFGGWSRQGERQQARLLWYLILPTVTFLALWLSGRIIWTLFLWLCVGEKYVPFANWTSAMFAMVVSAMLLARLATARVTGRYLRINAWGMGLCVSLLSVFYLIEVADRIDGWTAREAAENKIAYLMKPSNFYPGHLPRRIADETTPILAAHNGKAFALYIGDAQAAEVRVMPYYRWWWTVSYFRTTPFAGENLSTKEQFERFRESLKKEPLQK